VTWWQDRAELERTGRLAELIAETVTGAIRSLARDALLQNASGGWRPGQADPADFVPGDAAAIRAIVCDAIVRGRGRRHPPRRPAADGCSHGPGVQWLLDQPVSGGDVHQPGRCIGC
jgi:hypothetical protein